MENAVAEAVKSAPAAEVVVKDAQGIIKHPDTWVANLTSLLAAATAVVAVFHPGFTLPVSTETAIVAVGTLAASFSQIGHFTMRRSGHVKIAVAQIQAGVPAPVTTVNVAPPAA
jgi:hypothetical protein